MNDLTRPPQLTPGATIGVAAISGPVDPARLDAGIAGARAARLSRRARLEPRRAARVPGRLGRGARRGISRPAPRPRGRRDLLRARRLRRIASPVAPRPGRDARTAPDPPRRFGPDRALRVRRRARGSRHVLRTDGRGRHGACGAARLGGRALGPDARAASVRGRRDPRGRGGRRSPRRRLPVPAGRRVRNAGGRRGPGRRSLLGGCGRGHIPARPNVDPAGAVRYIRWTASHAHRLDFARRARRRVTGSRRPLASRLLRGSPVPGAVGPSGRARPRARGPCRSDCPCASTPGGGCSSSRARPSTGAR